MKCPALLTLGLLFTLFSAATATTYVLNPDGTGDFPTIQSAITGAETGDIIELTDGTYSGIFNITIDFEGKAVTVRSQSGDPEACIIDCEGSESDPVWGVRFESGEGPGSVLEGVTITNGWVGGGTAGAALRCRSGSSPTLRNCRFINNHAWGGAGIWCQISSPTIIDCVFSGNTATNEGAALFCTDSSPTVTNCSFVDNTAADGGGAFSCNFAAATTFTGCTFSGNVAQAGAAIRCEDTSATTFTGCTFYGNTGSSGGMIIYCQDTATVTLTNCIIASSTEGASILCDHSSSATFSCCNIYDNPGGDWVGCIATQVDQDGNFSADPQFCSTTPGADGNWSLQSDSPCAPGNHPNGDDCGTIGAAPVGCSTTAVEMKTWGAIKASFR